MHTKNILPAPPAPPPKFPFLKLRTCDFLAYKPELMTIILKFKQSVKKNETKRKAKRV